MAGRESPARAVRNPLKEVVPSCVLRKMTSNAKFSDSREGLHDDLGLGAAWCEWTLQLLGWRFGDLVRFPHSRAAAAQTGHPSECTYSN